MDSIIEDAMNGSQSTSVQSTESCGTTDEELERYLSALQTKVTVVGCGGGGNNAVTRMNEGGITVHEYRVTEVQGESPALKCGEGVN